MIDASRTLAHVRASANGHRELFVPARDAMEAIAALPEEDQALWATALLAGPRLGELRALRVCDLELNETIDDYVGTAYRFKLTRTPISCSSERVVLVIPDVKRQTSTVKWTHRILDCG